MTSKNSSTLPTAAKAATQILGFYDSIPATDKKAFTAGLVEMLSGYPQAVLERAASPSRGLPAIIAYPNLAKFKEKLDAWYDEHLATVHRKAVEQPKAPKRVPPPLPADWGLPGRLANVHIPATHPRYPSLCEWAQTADQKWWKYGRSSDGVDGIWIPLNQWQEPNGTVGRAVKEIAGT